MVPLTFSPQVKKALQSGSQSVLPRPAAAPGNWLETYMLRPNPALLNRQLWG